LAENFDVVGVFYEKEHFQPPFPVGPFFEAEEEAFEQEHYFNGKQAVLHEQVGPVHFTNRVHNPATVEQIKTLNVDIGVVFGCSILL
jgi:hypothetical protein